MCATAATQKTLVAGRRSFPPTEQRGCQHFSRAISFWNLGLFRRGSKLGSILSQPGRGSRDLQQRLEPVKRLRHCESCDVARSCSSSCATAIAARRFPLEPRERVGIGRDGLRENFDRHVAIQLRVPRPLHLSHPARADRRENLLRAEASPGGKCHGISAKGILSRDNVGAGNGGRTRDIHPGKERSRFGTLRDVSGSTSSLPSSSVPKPPELSFEVPWNSLGTRSEQTTLPGYLDAPVVVLGSFWERTLSISKR